MNHVKELGLSAAWLVRRAISEFVARHHARNELEPLLHDPGAEAGGSKQAGGLHGA